MANKSKKKQSTNGTNEPLKIFGEAKEKINRLYERLDECVNKASKFYSDQNLEPEIIKNVNTRDLQQLTESIDKIKNILSRNHMKVVFFGFTSNGKSTVINAILRDKVVPMSWGHTTACFLQIQGGSSNEAFFEVQGNDKRPIRLLEHIANASKPGSLECSTLVKIYLPVSKCALLKHDVVLVDSPGVDVEDNLDDWIDEHCLDADLFVLVSNTENSLSKAERNFFHKVSQKLSKPNIFILNNKWDSIANDHEIEPSSKEGIKASCMKRAVKFLSEELEVSSVEEAQQRTFFVSAKEALISRCTDMDSSATIVDEAARNSRLQEFENFEHRFEEALSRSAVRTKFTEHTEKGKKTVKDLSIILNNTQALIEEVHHSKASELQKVEARFNGIDQSYYRNKNDLSKLPCRIKERIQNATDSVFENELRRLSRVVSSFEMEFSTNHDKINHYKEQLYDFVTRSLSENLQSEINSVIRKHVNPFNETMITLSKWLTKEGQLKIEQTTISQSHDKLLVDLEPYKQFYTAFQEDLEFRFSLGLVSIIRKFQSRFSPPKTLQVDDSMNQSQVTFDSVSSSTDFLSIMERFMLNSPQSPTTVGSLAVGGILVRTVGLKVIVVTTVIYGALYAYEYLTWTNSAKERAFKAQYVKYARKGLQNCAPIIGNGIAKAIEQGVTTTLREVEREFDSVTNEIKERRSMLTRSLEKLAVCEQFTKELLGENDTLMTELVAFATSFLLY